MNFTNDPFLTSLLQANMDLDQRAMLGRTASMPFSPTMNQTAVNSFFVSLNDFLMSRLQYTQSEPLTQSFAHMSRYKTELCRPFEESGVCKYCDKCQFAHGVHELRSLLRHPKYKTELCRTFHSTGYCPYGSRCHFVHSSQEALDRAKSMPSSSSDFRPPFMKNSSIESTVTDKSSIASLSPDTSSSSKGFGSDSPSGSSSDNQDDGRLPIFNDLSQTTNPFLM